MTFHGEGRSQADLVEALADGTGRDAKSIAAGHSEVTQLIASWIREAAHAGNWTRVDKFANLAAPLRAPGLGEAHQEILDSGAMG
ncbi:hypothetical protein [Streptomyces edwardsiae]|uniref:Uncharacterized protein n=1 Tax=Streptomyces edwardsiae TaxID=3075527 RepID=A0ABU2PW16_9ACTN|nr:hypothetical protein [Streptomyces sp. DSM 41636]MDT0396373.1 hypothetical protein [Streptomyces sp. DSM 41636]